MKLAYMPEQNHNQTSDFHSKHALENPEIESKSPIFCESHVYSEIQGSRGERNLSVSFKAQVRTGLRLSSEKQAGLGWKTQVQLWGRNKAIANKETSEKNYFQVQNAPAEHPTAGLPPSNLVQEYLCAELKGTGTEARNKH